MIAAGIRCSPHKVSYTIIELKTVDSFSLVNLGIYYFINRPYHYWKRSYTPNLYGLIRQYFKKSSDFTSITNERIKEVKIKLKTRPRKMLNFEKPIFVMDNLLINQK